MAIKQVDEKRCRICRGIYPDESDAIDAVYLNEDGVPGQKFIGYFCQLCRPPSAYISPKTKVYIVEKMG